MSYDIDDISPGRRAVDRAIIRVVERLLDFFARHWLFILNSVHFSVLGIALLVPVLMYLGFSAIGSPIFESYHLICHQLPYRSEFLFGYQVAVCQRDVAIYASMGVTGAAFSLVRGALRPLSWRLYFLLILPMAVDGTAQLFGLHESTMTLRTVTGGLFGAATVWLAYPRLQVEMDQLRESLSGPNWPGKSANW